MIVLTGQLMQMSEEKKYIATLKAIGISALGFVIIKIDCSVPRPGISQDIQVLKM